jgi:hypothetical protein
VFFLDGLAKAWNFGEMMLRSRVRHAVICAGAQELSNESHRDDERTLSQNGRAWNAKLFCVGLQSTQLILP